MKNLSPGSSAFSAYAALTTAAVVWGGSVVAQKVALGPFSPVETSVFRGLGALLILIPLWLWKEGAVSFSRRDWRNFFFLGIGVLGNHLFVLFGLQFIGAGAAGIIIGSSPAITAFLSSLILKDIPLRVIWLGCLVSFLGVLSISGREAVDGLGSNPLLGGSLVVCALVSWALYTIGCRKTMERFSPLTVTWTTLLLSLIFEIPLLSHKSQSPGYRGRVGSGIRLAGTVLRYGVCHGIGSTGLVAWGQRNRSFQSGNFWESYSGFCVVFFGDDFG